jgi:hypothetical protein
LTGEFCKRHAGGGYGGVMRSKQLGLAGALLISTLSSSAWADLVTNGNFSAGNTTVCHDQTCPGWTVTLAPTGSALLFNDDNKDLTIPPGTGFVTFGATEGIDDKISQVIPTIARQTYTVSFQFWVDTPTGPQDFKVMLGSTVVYSETNDTTGSVPCGAGMCVELTPSMLWLIVQMQRSRSSDRMLQPLAVLLMSASCPSLPFPFRLLLACPV